MLEGLALSRGVQYSDIMVQQSHLQMCLTKLKPCLGETWSMSHRLGTPVRSS